MRLVGTPASLCDITSLCILCAPSGLCSACRLQRGDAQRRAAGQLLGAEPSLFKVILHANEEGQAGGSHLSAGGA